jgi:hypothetical protein
VTGSANLLNSLDRCPKMASLAQKMEREALSPHQLLTRAVELGLAVDSSDAPSAASDEVYRLGSTRPIDTELTDLIGLVEHIASLAEIITWILRTEGPWTHPAPTSDWTPSLWIAPSGLRRVVLADRWDERRALAETRDWQTLEGAILGEAVTIIAVQLGPMREGRRHGPLTKGWLHPRSKELRFKRRDGQAFDGNWEPVWRERFEGTREDWLHTMIEDEVMEETIQIHPVEWTQEEIEGIGGLAKEKMGHVGTERNLTRCFDPIHPCQFRFPCSFFKEPELGSGFVQIEESTAATPAPSSAHKVWRRRSTATE